VQVPSRRGGRDHRCRRGRGASTPFFNRDLSQLTLVPPARTQTGEFCYDFIALRREVDSTHGFYPLSTPNQHAGAGAGSGAATHVKPASINSSEERLRHRHEVAANGGHEVRYGQQSRLSGADLDLERGEPVTADAGGGPSQAPPANSREAQMAAGMNGGHEMSEKPDKVQ
jgi:hypothetical protein